MCLGSRVLGLESGVLSLGFRVLKILNSMENEVEKYEIPKRDKSILPLMQVAPGA